jgi:hypothetical protein
VIIYEFRGSDMHKYIWWILPLVLILLLGCGPTNINADLGETFTLAIGQSAHITSEGMEVNFIEVIADSRCPEGVQCIWAGEASSLLKITHSGSTYQKVLTQPSLTEPPQTDFFEYVITFNLQPYPKAGEEIKDKDYRLELKIEKETN